MPVDPSIRIWKTHPGQAGYPNTWPCWKSPDVFVDNNGNRTATMDPTVPNFKYYLGVDQVSEPEKGIPNNRLFALVRNLGSAPVNDVKVSFSYSPYGMVGGTLYQHVHFKSIADVMVDLGAAGSADAEKEVEVWWDLSDLSENNGGLWPAPLAHFDHFCVRVILQHPVDSNPGDNFTQHNLVNVVSTSSFAPLPLVVANSEREPKTYVLVAQNLPEGWGLRVRGLGDRSEEMHLRRGVKFTLKPGEERFLTLMIIRGERVLEKSQLIEISLMVDEKPVGGVSLLASKGEPGIRPRKMIMRVPGYILSPSKSVLFHRE